MLVLIGSLPQTFQYVLPLLSCRLLEQLLVG